MADTIKTNLGPVTAYADAKAHGYTGTREEFGQLLANAGLNLKAAETAKEGAEAAKQAAETAQKAAAENQKNAGTQAANAKASADTAAEQAAAAKESATGAANSASAAQESETNAGQSANAAANAEAAAKQAQQAAETAKTDAEAAKTAAGSSADAAAASAAEAKKTLESIPDDYSTLSGKVDENTSGISELKEDAAALQKRQNVLVGSETGNPASCDDAFAAPLCGLTIYGKSTQDGTPSPDNPVQIVSVGDSGTIKVIVTGANLLDPSKIFDLEKSQSQSTVKDGHVTGSTRSKYAQIGFILKDELSTQYTFSLSGGMAGVSTELRVYTFDNNSIADHVASKTVPAGEKASLTFKTKTDEKREYAVWFRPNDNGDYDFYDIQLELGSTATAYEPYHEQLLTLQTPTGLPGIPVTSGGNYADPQGQQWVCDEVDLARGVKVQRVDKAALDDTKTLTEQNAILATPIETPLTPAELAAYKALTTYAPDTVVQASDGAWVKLDYQRDVNLVIKNLEDAIASMTTT